MDSISVIRDGFERVRDELPATLEGLTPDELAFRSAPDANTVAWLVWHLVRVQDDHVAKAAGADQIWTSRGWVDRFGLPFDAAATGYGFTSEQVGAVRVASGGLLSAYFEDVHARTLEFLSGLGESDLDRIVDERWDPPVSLGVRLVSILADDLQHVGQAALLRGLIERARASS